MKSAPANGKSRTSWRLLVLLWIFGVCVFLVVDLFLNVAEFDEVRPDWQIYRATRFVAHDMVGEKYEGGSIANEVAAITSNSSRKPASTGGRPRNGHWRELYADGTVAVQGSYRNGKRHGEWIWRHTDGTLAEREMLIDGLRVGEVVRFHENGTKAAEGNYENGKRAGDWCEWHANGKVAAAEHYVDGKREGRVEYLHANGTASQRGSYAADLAVGRWETFHTSGRPAFDGDYLEGARDGVWVVWADWGKVIREDVYDHGKRTNTIDWSSRRHPRDHGDLEKTMLEAGASGG